MYIYLGEVVVRGELRVAVRGKRGITSVTRCIEVNTSTNKNPAVLLKTIIPSINHSGVRSSFQLPFSLCVVLRSSGKSSCGFPDFPPLHFRHPPPRKNSSTFPDELGHANRPDITFLILAVVHFRLFRAFASFSINFRTHNDAPLAFELLTIDDEVGEGLLKQRNN